MEPDLRQERKQAHALLDLLPAAKLGAVRNLLEIFLNEDSYTLSPAEAKAIAEADEWSKDNVPIANEEVLAEFGLSRADWEKMSREP